MCACAWVCVCACVRMCVHECVFVHFLLCIQLYERPYVICEMYTIITHQCCLVLSYLLSKFCSYS